MPDGEIVTIEQFIPYVLAAVVIVLSAAAYYIRDTLRERSRLVQQKNNLDVAKREMDLKLAQQENAYKQALQATITDLNERMTSLQERYQGLLDQEIDARNLLEQRITEVENHYQGQVRKLQEENEILKTENQGLSEALSQLKQVDE